ncbi:MAG: hypothetical protein ACFFEE_08515, partial [Candidatus Thorarchaeota archaeon]
MEFTEKPVLILVESRPFGKIIAAEGWRAAVGMFGMDHEPQLLFPNGRLSTRIKTGFSVNSIISTPT